MNVYFLRIGSLNLRSFNTFVSFHIKNIIFFENLCLLGGKVAEILIEKLNSFETNFILRFERKEIILKYGSLKISLSNQIIFVSSNTFFKWRLQITSQKIKNKN